MVVGGAPTVLQKNLCWRFELERRSKESRQTTTKRAKQKIGWLLVTVTALMNGSTFDRCQVQRPVVSVLLKLETYLSDGDAGRTLQSDGSSLLALFLLYFVPPADNHEKMRNDEEERKTKTWLPLYTSHLYLVAVVLALHSVGNSIESFATICSSNRLTKE